VSPLPELELSDCKEPEEKKNGWEGDVEYVSSG
jgi:hypothetical protein